MDQELIALKNEIRDLKTAQITPGNSTLHYARGDMPAGTYKGIYTWIIAYEDEGTTDAPITSLEFGPDWSLGPYHTSTNSQAIELYADSLTTVSTYVPIYSSRPIISITGPTKTADIDEYNPPSPVTWTQVRTFDHNDMGTAVGWCLMNCRLGFGIQSGTFANAIADMQSQRANGTLHGAGTTPPSYLQVPVYINTGTVDGHVVVWDKGTVWSDGVRISQGLSYYGLNNVWGWGELCDGARVVRRS